MVANGSMRDIFLPPHLTSPFHCSQNEIILLALKNVMLGTSLFFLIKPCHGNFLSTLQVGFCNIIKKAKDQVNHLWVAEASENSTYFLNLNAPHCSHLKDAAASAERWAKISAVVCILGF